MVIAIFAREHVLADALTQEALLRGYKVRCYQGRLADYAMLREAVSGADAAVCALCYPPEPRLHPETEAGIHNVIYALEEEGTGRLAALIPAAERGPVWRHWFGRRFRSDWQKMEQVMRRARQPWKIVPQRDRIYRKEKETAVQLLDMLEEKNPEEDAYGCR